MGISPSLKGKTAIITGTSSGIGRAIGLALAEAGVQCVLAARREKDLKKLADEIQELGVKVLVLKTDVAQEEDLNTLVTKTIREFKHLHILINNAGVYHRGRLEKLEVDKLLTTINVNLIAPMLLTKLALPYLKKESHSAVINISSIAGTMGFARGSAYAASKHGMLGFSDSLFEEVREDGIKVCAICPGFVATPMTIDRGLIKEKMIPAEDVAKMVVDILTMTPQSCPSKIILRPQYSPYE